MPTLLVIDMQPHFDASQRKWMIRNVSAEIKAAVKAGYRIVFLEYTHTPKHPGVAVKNATDRRLIKLVAKYIDALVIHKQEDDGSVEVAKLLESLDGNYPGAIREEIRVVGVNTGACVAKTVNGMAKLMPMAGIVVVGRACNQGWRGGQEEPGNEGLTKINDQPNVTVLKVPPVRKSAAA